MVLEAKRREPTWADIALTVADDTEESVLGSDLHQDAIFALRDTLRRYAAKQRLRWYVSSQVELIVPLPRREDWHPSPDIFVVTGMGLTPRTSYDVRRDGPMPQFVTEVASRSTWPADVGSKADAYRLAGVREYIVFDPTGDFLGTSVRAWRGASGNWAEWRPDKTDAWQSSVLGVAFRPEGLLLRMVDSQGHRIDTSEELAARVAELEELATRVAALEEEIERLRGAQRPSGG